MASAAPEPSPKADPKAQLLTAPLISTPVAAAPIAYSAPLAYPSYFTPTVYSAGYAYAPYASYVL